MSTLRRTVVNRAWLFAIAFGLFAYGFHKIGSLTGLYDEFWWFQIVAHFLSASAMALLLARTAIDQGFSGARFVAFVIAFSVVGAVGWELVEYFRIIPSLIWWGVEDSLLDLAVDAVGVASVLALFRTRFRAVVDPSMRTPRPFGDRLSDD